MRVVFEFTSDQVASIERYLQSMIQIDKDEITGAQVATRLPGHESVEDFLLHNMGTFIHSIVQQHPMGAFREKLAVHKKLQAEIMDSSKPAIVEVK
jgi:hypothetical protein